MDLQPMTTSYCRHSTLSLQNGKRAVFFPYQKTTGKIPVVFCLKKTFLVFMSESLHDCLLISSFKADRPTDHRKFLRVFYIKELWAIICR